MSSAVIRAYPRASQRAPEYRQTLTALREAPGHLGSRSGTARRNAEAGTQIARSVDTLSKVLAKPVVTAEDMSHVDRVIEILKDKLLLPPDPRGRYFRLVSRELAGNPALSRILIVEDDHTRRKGLIEGILEDAGIVIPIDDAAGGPVYIPDS
ncbi:hypothetical protein B0H14DRAFT_3501075 [Mycena olivaceomarginata]|nr:hypothetical protein B0H14DRAFT_3501075 [Mycena olivaceomarginata]